MFVIFGWEKKVEVVRPLIDTYCYACAKLSTWEWWRETEWVSLYFVKVIPFRTENQLVCKFCGDSLKLLGSEVRRLKRLKNFTPEQSQNLHDHLVLRLEEHQFKGKTEIQINWARMKRQSRLSPDA